MKKVRGIGMLVIVLTLGLYILIQIYVAKKDMYKEEGDNQKLLFICFLIALLLNGAYGKQEETTEYQSSHQSSYHSNHSINNSTNSNYTYHSSNSNSNNSYDSGYDDYYENGDYDQDRYDQDSSYADGVDDAMEDEE